MSTKIYYIKNTITGKMYIGQTANLKRRIAEHLSSSGNRHLREDVERYGRDIFDYGVLESAPRESLSGVELKYIRQYRTLYPDGYNIVQPNPKTVITPTHRHISAKNLTEIIYTLQNTTEPWHQIAARYRLHVRTIYYINSGESHYQDGLTYPLRDIPKITNTCVDCGVDITRKATRCAKCDSDRQKRAVRPDVERLILLIKMYGFEGTGRKYGVSGNAIRKWCKSLGLPTRKTDALYAKSNG